MQWLFVNNDANPNAVAGHQTINGYKTKSVTQNPKFGLWWTNDKGTAQNKYYGWHKSAKNKPK